jgi:glycosyltransferase involved in cell wall biosynthesis
MSAYVRVDGKHFSCGDERFAFRGVTYGTFQPRHDAARYPDRDDVKRDFAAMKEAGFTVVRTYTPPPDDVVDLAADWGLRLLVDAFHHDWRYVVGTSRPQKRRMVHGARAEVRSAARRYAGNPGIVALSLGNEIPADVVRWFGTAAVVEVIEELAEVVREEDPHRLVTYANYPTTEFLPLDCLDFLTVNVFLEDRAAFRRYLTRLHHLAGDRPLVLGEMGVDSGDDRRGEARQASVIDWQVETALERGVAGTCLFSWTDEWWVGDAAVEGWHFGLTRADRSPRPALDVATRWNGRSVADLPFEWPTITVVICAYNAAATVDECLRHTCALDYPNLEILVVDDGSTDATAEIVARHHPRARLLHIPHVGLAAARNAGLEAATGELVAYLDSDAYPSAEWPYYLALGMDSPAVGGVGGPNVPPVNAAPGAHRVARAPGGPIHVLLSDDRAEHVPGCNMAFWKEVLVESGGFDPVYTSAGDDVDLCWRVVDRGWDIAFHPAALVWHHRRDGLRPYLRQQLGYGRSEALVEARHPDRFTAWGTARWRGSIYGLGAPTRFRQRIYRGQYGAAAFQSVYRGGGHLLDLAHQVGLPVVSMLLLTAPLGLLEPILAVPAVLAVVGLALLGGVDVVRARPPRTCRAGRLGFRTSVAAMHLLQPLVRTWGRERHRAIARRRRQSQPSLPGPMRAVGGGTLLAPHEGPRAEVTAAAVAVLQMSGLRVAPGTGWENFDARVMGGPFVVGELLTSSHPQGWVQLRVRRRLRWRAVVAFLSLVCLVAAVDPLSVAVVVGAGLAEMGRELWRTRSAVHRVLKKAAA